MKVIRSSEFKADRPWGAVDIASMNGITTRLHWTNRPYKWHVNSGAEVFVVLGGTVHMFYIEQGVENVVVLNVGDIFFASTGTKHVAHPIGEARILVIEEEGSI